MELQQRIVQEARRQHSMDQQRRMINTMCSIEFSTKNKSTTQVEHLAKVYVAQAGGGKLVMMLGEAFDAVVECTTAALDMIAEDWALETVSAAEEPILHLNKHSGWDAERKSFARSSRVFENPCYKANKGAAADKTALLALLDIYIKFVRMLQPSVQSPFS